MGLMMKLLHGTDWHGPCITPGNDRHVGPGYLWTQCVNYGPCCRRFGSRVLEVGLLDIFQFSWMWNFLFVNTIQSQHTFYKFILVPVGLPCPPGATLLNRFSPWTVGELFSKIEEYLSRENLLFTSETHVHIGIHTNGKQWLISEEFLKALNGINIS